MDFPDLIENLPDEWACDILSKEKKILDKEKIIR
jgi:hypothetical protein